MIKRQIGLAALASLLLAGVAHAQDKIKVGVTATLEGTYPILGVDGIGGFNAAVKKIREVEECHMIAGRFDYLLKIRTHDIRRYRDVLGEKISTLPYVASTSTSVAMEAIKDGMG